MRVRFTPTARKEFLAIVSFLQSENRVAARRLTARAAKAFRRLARFPLSGHVIPEFPELPFREFSLAPYRVFYRINGRTVWIVAIWHGARIPRAPE